MEMFLEIKDPENAEKVKMGASKGGKIGGTVTGAKAVELQIGFFNPANKEKVKEGRKHGSEKANKQLWESTLDGFVSTAGGVTSHNRSIGGTGKDKIKLTQQ
jgi:hypothetical protein